MSGPSGRAAEVVTVVLGAMLLLVGCKEVEEVAAPVHEPAIVENVAGADTKQVTFDEAGAEQVSLRTAKVVKTRRGTVAPYAALIYDSQGLAWVYTNPEPLTFRRAQVVVDRVVDNQVWIKDGPPPGTRVVTVGAAEVYGAELDIAGGH